NDAPDSEPEQVFDNRHAADSTTDLNLRIGDGYSHFAQDVLILRLPLKRSVEIHDVQPVSALLHPFHCHFNRVAVDGHIVLDALFEPHRFAAKDVDRRINLHSRAKLSSRRSPMCWLFSGWNCVAQTFLAWTMAGNSIS